MDDSTYLDALRHELEQYKDRPGFAEQAEQVEAEIARVESLSDAPPAPPSEVEPEPAPVDEVPAS